MGQVLDKIAFNYIADNHRFIFYGETYTNPSLSALILNGLYKRPQKGRFLFWGCRQTLNKQKYSCHGWQRLIQDEYKNELWLASPCVHAEPPFFQVFQRETWKCK